MSKRSKKCKENHGLLYSEATRCSSLLRTISIHGVESAFTESCDKEEFNVASNLVYVR